MVDVLTQMQDSHNIEANEWVVSWLRRLPPRAKVLDFASGHGRHALAALALELEVDAWDQDAIALEGIRLRSEDRVRTRVCDLESQAWPAATGKFDAVIVTNYLFRPRLAFLSELLNVGGILIYQTFALGHETLGRPRRQDFLLRPGELFERALAMGLHVLSYHDSVVASLPPGNGQNNAKIPPSSRVQRLVALKHEQRQIDPELLSAWPVNIQG
jgi:SAM-dependent methyltransferase